MAMIETHMSVSGLFDVRANICWQALDLHLNWTMETSSLVQFLKVSFILMSLHVPRKQFNLPHKLCSGTASHVQPCNDQ